MHPKFIWCTVCVGKRGNPHVKKQFLYLFFHLCLIPRQEQFCYTSCLYFSTLPLLLLFSILHMSQTRLHRSQLAAHVRAQLSGPTVCLFHIETMATETSTCYHSIIFILRKKNKVHFDQETIVSQLLIGLTIIQ